MRARGCGKSAAVARPFTQRSCSGSRARWRARTRAGQWGRLGASVRCSAKRTRVWFTLWVERRSKQERTTRGRPTADPPPSPAPST